MSWDFGGIELFYGDFTFNIFGNELHKIDADASTFNFKYIYPDNKSYKKVEFGNIYSRGLFRKAFRGISLTNEYRNHRGTFDKLIISKYTFPDAFIEIYRNNSLVQNIKSDDKGFYSIEIPIYYGSNNIEFKIYGPHGERDSFSFIHDIKNNLLKENEFIYDVSLGNDSKFYNTEATNLEGSNYLSANAKYGITNYLTVDSGLILSDTSNEEAANSNGFINKAPSYNSFYSGLHANIYGRYNFSSVYKYEDYINTSVRYLGDDFFLNTFFIKSLNEFSQSNIVANTNIQLGAQNISFSLKHALEDDLHEGYNSFSSSYGVRFTSRLFSNITASYIDYSEISSYKNDFVLNSNIQYSLNHRWLPKFLRNSNLSLNNSHSLVRGPISNRFKFEKSISANSRYSFFYDSYTTNAELGTRSDKYRLELKHDFEYFYAFNNYSYFKDNNYSISFGIGSNLSYNDKLDKVYFDSWKELGKGAVSIVPYEDVNGDKKFNSNDIILKEAALDVNGGVYRLKHINNIYHSSSVVDYQENLVKGKEFSDGDAMYVPLFKAIGFQPRPNLFSTIYYPFLKSRDLSAFVYDKQGNPFPGLEIHLENLETGEITSTISDFDGEVYYDRLKPGKFVIFIDKEQLNDLNLESSINNIEIDFNSPDFKEYQENIFHIRRSN